MEFQNVDDVKSNFLQGKFQFPDEIMVNDIKYTSNMASSYNIKEMITKKYKAMWVYFTANKDHAAEKGLGHALVFLWGFPPNKNAMIPYDVRFSTRARLNAPIIEKTDDSGNIIIAPEKIIGDIVDVVVTNLPGSEIIRGKVDTGADISSLHADNWEISNGHVAFLCPALSEHKITLPLLEKQAIKLSNGTVEYRPVIELNVKVNDIPLTKCMFNLNDRGAMKYSMLVGQNILEPGGFMVDPKINDEQTIAEATEINWDDLQEEFKDVDAPQ